MPICINLRSCKITKILISVDFHSLYQLLHSQVHHNGVKLWISNVEIYFDNYAINKMNENQI